MSACARFRVFAGERVEQRGHTPPAPPPSRSPSPVAEGRAEALPFAPLDASVAAGPPVTRPSGEARNLDPMAAEAVGRASPVSGAEFLRPSIVSRASHRGGARGGRGRGRGAASKSGPRTTGAIGTPVAFAAASTVGDDGPRPTGAVAAPVAIAAVSSPSAPFASAVQWPPAVPSAGNGDCVLSVGAAAAAAALPGPARAGSAPKSVQRKLPKQPKAATTAKRAKKKGDAVAPRATEASAPSSPPPLPPPPLPSAAAAAGVASPAAVPQLSAYLRSLFSTGAAPSDPWNVAASLLRFSLGDDAVTTARAPGVPAASGASDPTATAAAGESVGALPSAACEVVGEGARDPLRCAASGGGGGSGGDGSGGGGGGGGGHAGDQTSPVAELIRPPSPPPPFESRPLVEAAGWQPNREGTLVALLCARVSR